MDALRNLTVTAPRARLSKAANASGKTRLSGILLRTALVAIAGLAGTTAADAAIFWWQSDSAVASGSAPGPSRKAKARRRVGAKLEAQVKEHAKPQGPLVIAISIDRQQVKVYDANGLFAESPVSTGMRGHSTPMGVFSVIQKHKWHQSNIYSGAPMPYMQRVTWSGVAMHAGVLPGYPASHGCIRMPMAFAVKMWGWTRMGARVIITPGEVSPSEFSHPLLTAQKSAPAQPMAAASPADDAKSAVVAVSLQRSGGPDLVKTSATADSVAPAGQAKTADAGGAMPDAATSPVDAGAGSEAAAPDQTPSEPKIGETTIAADAPAPAAERAREPAKTVDTTDDKSKTGAERTASGPDAKKDQARPSDAERGAVNKPDAVVAAPPRRTGQIAAFISRKDSRLYVRQNFAPLFDVPVTIAPSDRPLGTHVFTARADKDDAKLFHWSVVSLPAAVRRADRRDVDEGALRRRKATGAIEMKTTVVPDTAAEALDRLTIPDDAMARITDALATGGSLVVSDQGIAAGETGEGTDFIVSLR